ncbi:hypothetical protein [Sphingobacterium sp. LRF_L2]|uniref:hypothetical protein n=1 Tax=Sphingobacterium sp. LRF_L2 TaxID=3369421 RepID=UPI003F5EC82C
MVVEIRKAKITKAIFNQILAPSLPDLVRNEELEVLGWVFDKTRYILLQDTGKQAVYRLPIISDMKVDFRRPDHVDFKSKGYSVAVQLSGLEECNRWITRIHEIQSEARVKGQIFI